MIFYNFTIHLLVILYRIAALFNYKAKLFVSGRKGFFNKLSLQLKSNQSQLAWIHCASLGEFEQGRPIIEALKQERKNIKVLLTFFSPSGYEIRKNYEFADYVFYLPWDTPRNAKKFIEITKPSLAIFVKYEFWYNYSNELKKKNIPLLSVSCILRPEQAFFKSYGSSFRKILHNFDHFFVQNQETKKLLSSIGIKSTLAGDTRFDRVLQIIQSTEEIGLAKKFKNDQKLLVAGSCWPEDIDVLIPVINTNQYNLKFIIAPHEITEASFLQLKPHFK